MNEHLPTPDPLPPLIEAQGVGLVFRIGPRRLEVLQDVSLRVGPGETVAVRGASGAGKTTLLQILGGLERPTSGRVRFGDRSLYEMSEAARASLRARRIGFVFQAYHLLPELTVLENVLLPALGLPGGRRHRETARRRAESLVDQVGLRERAAHLPSELSGGEQQRTALARALMNDPELILADEPTGNLDSRTGAQVLDILFGMLRDRPRALMLVSHDTDVTARCQRTLFLRDGCLANSPS